MYSCVVFKMFLVIPKREYILLLYLLRKMSFPENVQNYSEETVHIPHASTMQSCVVLKLLSNSEETLRSAHISTMFR